MAATKTEAQPTSRYYSTKQSKFGPFLGLIGAIVITGGLFLLIPLSQLLDNITKSTKSIEEADFAPPPPPPPPPPPQPPPEEEEEPDEPPEMADESPPSIDLALPNLGNIASGTGGGFIIDSALASFAVDSDDLGAGDLFDSDDLDEKPEAVSKIPPRYPSNLRSAGATGNVTLEFVVDERGLVTKIKVKKTTNAKFNKAAIDAVSKWKFKPGIKNGKKVKSRFVVPINFKLKPR